MMIAAAAKRRRGGKWRKAVRRVVNPNSTIGEGMTQAVTLTDKMQNSHTLIPFLVFVVIVVLIAPFTFFF